MSFPTYSNMTGSGIEWVGDVPSHWVRKPLFALVSERNESNQGMIENNLLSLSYGRIVRKDIDNNDGLLPASFETYQVVEPNDMVWRLTDLQNDQRSLRTGIVRERGIITSAYLATQPHGIAPDYLSYLLRAYDLTKVFYSMGGGLRQSMKFADVKWLPVMLPPSDEQAAIAAFLDRETAKIDALIEEQRRLIALLKEKRQAVISHAVTRGLDPNAPMNDSGIEWFGEVPAHWASAKVKHACSHVVDCLHTTPTYDGDLLYPAIRTADIERGKLLLAQARLVSEKIYEQRIERLRPIANDVLYSREGERFGLAALVPIGVDLCLGQRMMMFRTLPHASPAYFMWALNSDAVYQQVVSGLGGATSPHINIGDIVNFRIPEPPLAEQRAIADHIAAKVAALDDLAEVAASAITLLQERRAALISAAVTGKIDVRGSAKVLPSPIDRARARGLIGTEIIERLAGQPTFGRVKFQKVAFLAEGHVGVSELEGSYLREAAGPLDRALIDDMEIGAHRLAEIERDQPGGSGTANTYRLGPRRGAHRQELADWLGADRTAKLDKLITDIADLSTRGAEAVATLYGVWNDALNEGAPPSDDEIISGFLNDWHDEKRKKFRASELPEWLGWMRRHGIVPNGSGPKSARQIGGLL